MPKRVALPDDGAGFRCCFGTWIDNESWRCPKEATAAMDEDTYRNFKVTNVSLHGRALCDGHLNLLAVD